MTLFICVRSRWLYVLLLVGVGYGWRCRVWRALLVGAAGTHIALELVGWVGVGD